MSAALKEYRERYRAARARLWGLPTEAVQRPRDILYISTPVIIYDEPIGPEIPAIREVAVPQSSWHDARRILKEVSVKYGVTTVDLCSERRPPYLCTARHEVYYRLRHETTWSYPRIGAFLGGRDHATVMHGVRKHAKRLRELEAGQ